AKQRRPRRRGLSRYIWKRSLYKLSCATKAADKHALASAGIDGMFLCPSDKAPLRSWTGGPCARQAAAQHPRAAR
ncbi:unnamed protein product, partial [Mycena citricolor]